MSYFRNFIQCVPTSTVPIQLRVQLVKMESRQHLIMTAFYGTGMSHPHQSLQLLSYPVFYSMVVYLPISIFTHFPISLAFFHEDGAWTPLQRRHHLKAGIVAFSKGSWRAAPGMSLSASCTLDVSSAMIYLTFKRLVISSCNFNSLKSSTRYYLLCSCVVKQSVSSPARSVQRTHVEHH